MAAGVLIIQNENTPDPISTGELLLQLSFAGPAGSPTGRGVVLTGFPPITQSFDTPLGLNTMTITRQSGGSGAFVGSSGQLVLDLVLAFESSLPSISKVTLPLHFTSGAVTSLVDQSGLTGTPMNAVGQIRLVATSVFVDEPGGLFSLAGSPCSFVLDGVVSPHP